MSGEGIFFSVGHSMSRRQLRGKAEAILRILRNTRDEGTERIGAYRTSDLIHTAGDCVQECTTLFLRERKT